MSCTNGEYHTVTLDEDGVVHCFGIKNYGQEYTIIVHSDDMELPNPLLNLPKIKEISCGSYFTVCVDEEGFVWSFGSNDCGQLGTGNTTYFKAPQQIHEIPPAFSVACGSDHTLIITHDSNLWSCGYNSYGQLCLGNQEDQSTFQQTSFSNISRVSSGFQHSLFQNYKGELFSCGYNKLGQLGLGHFDTQITPTLIPNVPPNIIQFVCGFQQNLFLDSEGNVFSFGCNFYGQLGLGHMKKQNLLVQIQNIPSIKMISCVGDSSYLLDFEGNVWSFGHNNVGQLGHGHVKNLNVPTKIEKLKDIQLLSYGPCGKHFLVKDSRNKIFVTGLNNYRQLTLLDKPEILRPTEMDPKYFTIWGEPQIASRVKSARK